MTKCINIAQNKTTIKYDLTENLINQFQNAKIGDKVNIVIENQNYYLKITGGSTDTGKPLYSAYPFKNYKKLKYKQNIKKGVQKRKLVYGGIISNNISQINTVVLNN